MRKYAGLIMGGLLLTLVPLLMGTNWYRPDRDYVEPGWFLGAVERLDHALEKGKLDLHLRAFYMNRSFDQGPLQRSMALGGWLTYTTAEFHGMSISATYATSIPFIYDDPDEGGAGVLTDDQGSINVLSEAYLQWHWGSNLVRVYRQSLNNPFLNPDDFREIPVTYEAYGIVNQSLPYTRLELFYVNGIKSWTDSTFQSMTQAAGINGVDEPIIFGGANVTPYENMTIQAYNYYCNQFMNTLFLEVDYTWHINQDWSLAPSVQYIDQRDVGDSVGGTFSTYALGASATLGWRGFSLQAAYTTVDDAYPIQQPWANYPAYTSMVELDNNQAGMDTWMLAAGWDHQTHEVGKINVWVFYTSATSPDTGPHASPDQQEFDLILRYSPPWVKDLGFILKYADVKQDNILGGQDFQDIRLILNWDFNLL